MADKQLAKKGKSGVDNTFRRTWDKNDFAERAAKREKEVGRPRLLLYRGIPEAWQAVIWLFDIMMMPTQEKDIEESALDAKKRRRLGEALKHLLDQEHGQSQNRLSTCTFTAQNIKHRCSAVAQTNKNPHHAYHSCAWCKQEWLNSHDVTAH